MREIGTPKIGSHISNSHIKRPRITVNQRIGSRKEGISASHIREIADKKTTYNEGCLYTHLYSHVCLRYCMHGLCTCTLHNNEILEPLTWIRVRPSHCHSRSLSCTHTCFLPSIEHQ